MKTPMLGLGSLRQKKDYLVPFLLCALAANSADPRQVLLAQAAPAKLKLVIIEGEGAINNIRLRTAREPIVQVEDENRRPVAGAAVVFVLPESGPGGSFANNARSITVMSDRNGRAVAKGFRVNNLTGKFEIQVEASHQDLTANTIINQSNAILTAAAAGISAKLIAILAIAGGAAAGGVIAATRGGDNGAPTQPGRAPTVLTPGTPGVGGPR